MPVAARHQILAIDLLRFACALLVVAFHVGTAFPLAETSSATRLIDPALRLPAMLAPFTWFGWVGVEIFFVISGYVIAVSADGVAMMAFLRRRALRLAPAAWLCASVTALVMLVVFPTPAATIIARWLAALAFYPVAAPIDPSYWTLAVECAFYVLVAACLARDGRNAARMETIALALGAASIAFWIVVRATGWRAEDTLGNVALNLTLLPHGIFFALGIMLSAIRVRGVTPVRVGAVGLLAAAAFHEVGFHALTMIAVPGIVADPRWPVLTFGLAIAVLVVAPSLQRPLATLGAGRLMTVGLMTYPLYLIHQNVAAALIVLLVRAGMTAWWAMALSVAIVVGLAWAITQTAEPAVRGWLAARWRVSGSRGPAPDSLPIASPPAG